MSERALNDGADIDSGHWPLRPFLLAGLCALAGLGIQQLVDVKSFPAPVERVAGALAIATATVGFALVAERVRLRWAIGFALALGAVAGAIYFWHGAPGESDFWPWRGLSLLLGLGVTIPLFQTARDAGGWRFDYPTLHRHAWTDAVIGAAANVFVGIVFMMSWLLALLFKLIKIDVLETLLEKHWFAAMLAGASFGGAIGLLRERDRVVVLLQRVVTSVLGVLAPVLGTGLLLFLLSLPFTGLTPLWDATRATTPILLSCVVGALLLANAVIGNGVEDEARNPVLRFGAMALGLAMLPLAAIAAIATGLRIDQYGFTPERLWGVTFVIIASAYGLAYLVSLGRGRTAWAPLVRSANTQLAFGMAGIALFLATPILSFNAISTNDQVARLTSGKIKPEKFDWAALAFDFGAPGRAALKRLATSGNAAIASEAKSAAKAQTRWEVKQRKSIDDAAEQLAKRIRIQPRQVPLPDGLLRSFEADLDAKNSGVLRYEVGGNSAVLVTEGCERCRPIVRVTRRDAKGDWKMEIGDQLSPDTDDRRALREGLVKRGFEIRPVERRQVYIDGKPVGEPFE
ncbi:MAG: DUF4153 domain-containing protein [Sphingobium sp.]|nr:DUF4153 domain-containing protein [Sphingobium sp.]